MNSIVNKITAELIKNADEKTRIQGEKFFKENIKIYGLRSALTEQISKEFYRTIADKSKDNIFSLCEELWQSGYME